MYHKKILFLSLKELREKCLSDLPELYEIALQSADPATFLTALQSRASQTSESAENPSPWQRAAAQEILRLIDQEGKTIRELSHDMELKLETLTNLWLFLRGNTPDNIPTDLFIDLYYLFLQLEGRYRPCSSDHSLHMQRWESGLDPTVMTHRERNRERIIDLLVSKIEQRHSTSSPYRFAEGMTTEEKREAVRGWWKNFRFHLSTAIKSPSELNHFLGGTLSSETMDLLHRAKKKGMPFFITPYYLSLLNIEKEGYDDRTIRSYVLYSENLVNTYGSIRAWEREDLVVAGEPNAAGWLLPGHNIHRRYPDVAIMIPDSIGRACGGLCAVCQRMYDFQSERLNFDFKQLIPKESWPEKLVRLMRYFENDSQLRDILVTGGDALMSRNATLRLILDEIYKMALRKRRANLARPDGEKFAELERVRLGSRLLAYLPMRIDQELIGILRNFKQKGAAVGIKQFIIQTHFESPLEMTPEAVQAINALLSAGWTVTNQLVFTVAASRRSHTARLRRVLNKAGVICYYTFSVKGFAI